MKGVRAAMQKICHHFCPVACQSNTLFRGLKLEVWRHDRRQNSYDGFVRHTQRLTVVKAGS